MASSQQQKDKKKKLNRNTLWQNGIDYHLKWETMRHPPDHINTLREALADTSCGLSTRFGNDCIGKMVITTDMAKLSQSSRPDVEKRLEEGLKLHNGKVEAAERLHGNSSDENGWRDYYKENLLGPLYKKHELKDTDSRLTSRTKFYYDHFQSREDEQWTLFKRNGPYDDRRQNIKYPKPDWAAHFPICDLEHPSAPGFAKEPLWDWSSNKNRKMVHEFDKTELQRLTNYGLQCHVSGAWHNKTKAKKMDPKMMFSFPWFIVEFKRTKGDATGCYCQVANAAACTLLMFETLSQYADREDEEAHIPPIITMTAVGKDVKLWIGYAGPNEEPSQDSEDDESGDESPNWFHSRCFWQGDMTKVKDAMDLEAVLENVYTWAMRVLRPRIVQYLGQWRIKIKRNTRTPLSRPLAENGDDVVEYVQYGFEMIDARLRNVMVAYHDETLQKVEELLSIHLAGVKPQIQKDLATQTNPFPIDRATEMDTSSKTNVLPLITTQFTSAFTSKTRETTTATTRANGSTSSQRRSPEIKANGTGYDAESNAGTTKQNRIFHLPETLSVREYSFPSRKTIHRPPLLPGGMRTESEPPAESTEKNKDLLRPELFLDVASTSNDSITTSIPEPCVGSTTHLARALSTGDLNPTPASRDSIRPQARVPIVTPSDQVYSFDKKDFNLAPFDFRFEK
ncbi:hypothetical protein BJ170DRAFT_727229 [Xylariales sp. AK1849]|nr:hypothetical protein BJ170DRAFT_727229 [Xylariales sp. AK1849]